MSNQQTKLLYFYLRDSFCLFIGSVFAKVVKDNHDMTRQKSVNTKNAMQKGEYDMWRWYFWLIAIDRNRSIKKDILL